MAPKGAPLTTIPPIPPTPLPQSIRSEINEHLIRTGSVYTIQSALKTKCQSTGWLDAVKARSLELLRDGECTSWREVMARVLEEARSGTKVETADVTVKEVNGRVGNGVKTNGINNKSAKANHGATVNRAEPRTSTNSRTDVRMPQVVINEGVKIIREVLDDVVEVVNEEEYDNKYYDT